MIDTDGNTDALRRREEEQEAAQPRWIPCPECDGEGVAPFEEPRPDPHNGGELVEVWLECENCHGQGEIEADFWDYMDEEGNEQ